MNNVATGLTEPASLPFPATPQDLTIRTEACPLEEKQFQQFLAGMPPWPDPPPEEPHGDEMLDPSELSSADALWDDFRAASFFLPPDAFNDAVLLT